MREMKLAALGLCFGESLTWSGMYQRSQRMAFWTRRLRREIAGSTDSTVLAPVLPFSLNQSDRPLRPGPGPHSEWFAFQLQTLAAGGNTLDAWLKLAQGREELLLSVAQHHALSNLQAGLRPPQSGHDNPHYFDDSAVFRALALTLVHPEADAAAIRADAMITNALDGVDAAAVIAVVATLLGQRTGLQDAMRAGMQEANEGSWLHRNLVAALGAVDGGEGFAPLLTRLDTEIVNHAYNYGNAAPETVPLALASVLHGQGRLEPSLLVAMSLPRNAGSVVPLVAALCLLARPEQAEAIKDVDTVLRGTSLPQLQGLDVLRLADDLKGPND